MTDNLPVINANQELAKVKTASTTLLGRGLAALSYKKLVAVDQDTIYRESRSVYDQITVYSNFNSSRWPEVKQTKLLDCFEKFKQLADSGYGKAYFPISRIYRGWQGVNADKVLERYYGELAFKWCFDNQLLNDPEIWCDLGTLYRCGIGVESDKSLGFFWYQKAAEAGHIGGQYFSGMCYSCEWWLGVNRDLVQSAFWYRKAAEQGFYRAQRILASLCKTGSGVEQDYVQAALWYRKAAEQGDEYAQLHLAEMLDYEKYVCESDDECELIEKEIFYWYRMAAEQGLAEAQYELGRCFEWGGGVEPDSQHAMFWYIKASEQGNTQAQVSLGRLFRRGHGSDDHEIKYQNAVFWFQKAAEKNDPYGQWELGICFWFGRGVKENVDLAIYWLREAVKRGYPISQEQQKRFGIEILMDE